MSITTREFLEASTLTREHIDRFLDAGAHNRHAFDPELGYICKNSVLKDGIDESHTIYRYGVFGERLTLNFADQPCRINTYGDSFTQCDQVSDGETWQEYLAAHLGEPIRNFGVGGHGVYQAYRRMRREESTKASAEYIVLNIYSDDHFRSIYRWRMLHLPGSSQLFQKSALSETTAFLFNANPWAHVRLNPETAKFEECENSYPTPESLYYLCDSEHIYQTFKDDFDVQACLAQQGATDLNLGVLQTMADALEMPTDFSSPEATSATARSLLQTCALHSSMYIVDKARAFAAAEEKEFMVLLSYPAPDVIHACQNRRRFDQILIDYLKEEGIRFFDSLHAHVEEFKLFNCSPEEYVHRYYIGHYNPRGNHFFAFAVKDAIVEWLTPKPPTYRNQGPSLQKRG
jgi:hypothetical protein